jgi:hypothetical protein
MTPAAAVLAFREALERRSWQEAADLVHPEDARRRQREDVNRLAAALAASGFSKEQGLGSGHWDRELFADLPSQELVDCAMAGYGSALADTTIDVDRVPPALSEQLTAMLLEMANQVDSLHAVNLRGSRMTSSPARSSSARARFASRVSSTASRRFSRASSSVAPWVLAPGNSSTNATYPSGTLR